MSDQWQNCYDGRQTVELWKEIEGFGGKYRISNYGRVFSSKTGKFLKPDVTADGYLRIRLSNKNHPKALMVHRLVLECFVAPCPGSEYQSNHKDGNKQNNKFDNLEWVTASENSFHAVKLGLKIMPRGEKHYLTKFKPNDIKRIRSLRGKIFSKNLGEEYGVKGVTIRAIWGRLNWKHVP